MRELIPWIAGIATAALCVLAGGGAMRRLAWRVGLVDRPKLRGVHGETVARSGGLAIAAGLMLALLAQMALARGLGLPGSYLADVDNVYLLLPALALLGTGLLDDLRPLGARVKLGVQVCCALWAYVLGFRFDDVNVLGLFTFSAGWLSLPLTLLFVVAVTNAFNMLDGVDGLCAGTAFVALAGIGAYSLLGGNVQLGLALPLAACALAFLRHNFGRPKSFLGDSGSTFLGFLVAALALRGVRDSGGAIALAPLFLLLSLPVVDICAAVARRLIQGTSPLRADRGHIHHITLILFEERSARASATLLAMAAVCAAGAMLAGAHAPLAAAVLALPVGLYGAIFARGGYLSLRNLRGAARATALARAIEADAATAGPADALGGERAIALMRQLRVTAMGLLDDSGRLVWCLGVPDLGREALHLPLFAGGKVRRGLLLVQGADGSADRLAFVAQLLIPLYPAFMEMLESKTRATGKVPRPLNV
ncbi:MAG: undecaprenyl/decaprenyl-phosphate alpha-N-acetylglucosaminyl 1-phosphate transferase [Planctomycetes bacterium]|jgi:UDP-GlcNAc:undecaprenyl-phosphate GlcNAc-1-phosphate transferase|nr:undecaprenyl/decaprenyl-phosphate alpha-N-acetylglucosaminyl 1-phosphate transferase [Planctomycetota bacterium]